MERFTIQQIEDGKIAIRIRDKEEGRKVVSKMKSKYTGSFPMDEYNEFCIAPFKNNGVNDGKICHCNKNHYTSNDYIVIEFNQIDFEENLLNNIQIW